MISHHITYTDCHLAYSYDMQATTYAEYCGIYPCGNSDWSVRIQSHRQ